MLKKNYINHLSLIIILIFLLYLITGVLIYDDYGISWDETDNRRLGFISLNYLRELFSLDIYQGFEHDDLAYMYSTKQYGVIFDLPMAFIEKLFNIEDPRNYFLLRHFFNFLIFYIATIFFYLLLKKRFSIHLSIIGLFFWILSPRIFADSFYNMKDIIFLSFLVISLYYAITFLNAPTYKSAFLLALTCSFAIDVRVLGVIVPFIVVVFFAFMVLDSKDLFKRYFPKFSAFILLLIFFTILFWPYLWSDPLNNFISAFKSMSSYPMRLNVFYLGNYVSSTNLPWHYPLVWIFISTPIPYLLLFLIGSFSIIFMFIRRFLELSSDKKSLDLWRGNNERMDIIFFLIFYFSIFLIIEMNSTLYGGWRHLFFVYPSLIFISIRGLDFVSKFLSIKYLYYLLIPFFLYTSFWMVKNHPFQFVYFNKLAGNNVGSYFELDYWGTSNKSSLEYIAKINNSDEINIYVSSVSPYYFSSLLLNKDDRKRIKFTKDIDDANFLVTNHYYQKGNPLTINEELKREYKLLKEFKVDNMIINSVYKIN